MTKSKHTTKPADHTRATLDTLVNVWWFCMLLLVLTTYYGFSRFDFSQRSPSYADKVMYVLSLALFAGVQVAIAIIGSKWKRSLLWTIISVCIALVAVVAVVSVIFVTATFFLPLALGVPAIALIVLTMRRAKQRRQVEHQ